VKSEAIVIMLGFIEMVNDETMTLALEILILQLN